MTIRTLPEFPEVQSRAGISWGISPKALSQWDASVQAAAAEDTSISIFDPIGADYVDGVTAKRVAGVLRALGGKDVVVNINSPGGSLFEGTTIYNILRDYKGRVTVRVMGMAASAASIIAMAGDEIQIARAGFIMVHNAWVMAVGNRHDLRDVAKTLEPFDRSMADVYANRSGIDLAKVQRLMDAETYIGGSEAVETGFADALLPADAISHTARAEDKRFVALKKTEIALQNSGLSRSERRETISVLTGTPSAAEGTPSAAVGGISPETTARLEAAVTQLRLAPKLSHI